MRLNMVLLDLIQGKRNETSTIQKFFMKRAILRISAEMRDSLVM